MIRLYVFILVIVSKNLYCQTQYSIGKIEYEMVINTGNSIDIFDSTLYYNTEFSTFNFQKKNFQKEVSEKALGENKFSVSIKEEDTTKTTIINDIRQNMLFTVNATQVIFEEKDSQNWMLHDDYKKISIYKCRKATLTFRGRDYIAWYSEQLALPLGPYKFYGLPGLIIEIADISNNVSFSMISINIPSVMPLTNLPNDRKKISRLEFKDQLKKDTFRRKKEFDEKVKRLESSSSRDTKIKINSSSIVVNNGIELD